MKNNFELWLDGDKMSNLNARDTRDQKIIEHKIRKKCIHANKKELEDIGNKLLKKKSNFIQYMLINNVNLTVKHRTAALKAVAKRRRTNYPSFLEFESLIFKHADLVGLSPQKCVNIMLRFFKHKNTIWDMTDKELDKLLFASSLENPKLVGKLKVQIKRALHRINKNEMLEMLLKYHVNRLKNNTTAIRNELLNGIGAYNIKSTISLENECYKLGLIKF